MSPPQTRSGEPPGQGPATTTREVPAPITKPNQSQSTTPVKPRWTVQRTRVRYLAAGDVVVSPRDGKLWMIAAIDGQRWDVTVRLTQGSMRAKWSADPDDSLGVLVDLERERVAADLDSARDAVRKVADSLLPADRVALSHEIYGGAS